MIRILAFICLCFFSFSVFSQSSCVHHVQRQKLDNERPDLIQLRESRSNYLENFTKNFSENQFNRNDEDILIPVVFHVVHDNGEENISDAQIHESIVQLNEDFAAINPELVDVHPNFENLVADVGFEFRLADLDPNGEPTTGINRIQSELTYNGSDLALKQLVQWDLLCI